MNSAKIVDGTVANLDLGADSVTADKIVDGTVANLDLGADSVTADKIVDGTVAGPDLGVDSVTRYNILDGTVTGVDVWDESLGSRSCHRLGRHVRDRPKLCQFVGNRRQLGRPVRDRPETLSVRRKSPPARSALTKCVPRTSTSAL